MARVKRGVTSKAKHKKVLKLLKASGEEEKYYSCCKQAWKSYAIRL